MKKVLCVSLLTLIIVVSFSGCSLHIADDWGWDSPVYRVILKVDPDDAEVLLNGKIIGYAYEFSTLDSALKLASRTNELVIKREGYIEEAVDLYDYQSHRIVIRLEMRPDDDYTATPPDRVKRPPKPTPPPKERMEEKPTTVEPETFPEHMEEDDNNPANRRVDVTIEISPEESAIYLNGKFWGLAPKSGIINNLRLKPGKYTLAVVKPGYKSYKEILFIADEPVKVSVKLVLQ
jgi:hypothetical protein